MDSDTQVQEFILYDEIVYPEDYTSQSLDNYEFKHILVPLDDGKDGLDLPLCSNTNKMGWDESDDE